MRSILLFLSLLAGMFLSCTKPAKDSSAVVTPATPATPVTPVTSKSAPLAGTIDKTDTLKVMAYNILAFGDGCQSGTTAALDSYLKTIVQYAQPDLLSCEKMAAFDPNSALPGNLAEDIKVNALNAAFPGRYAYAIPTNQSNSSTMSVLFYNSAKLTFLRTETLVATITDFDLYKLYYKDPNLTITHDSTFLYVVVNHDKSGDNSASRDQQIVAEMKTLRSKFANLPNLINMGDFNTRNSSEACYQAIVSPADTATQMSDPSFFPDKKNTYPADWDNNPGLFKPYLTTSTRASATVPNSCGTSGGAKSWYDHIFISPWLVSGSNYIKYIPNSYQTIGNDGNRLAVDINSSSPVTNTSAPDAVIQALFQMSNKYPVMIRLQVKANRNGYSLADPAERN